MIFAAGLSPAWQQILEFDVLHRGEVNRAIRAHWCASGKVLNVALAAKSLGVKTTVLSAVAGLSGQAIQEELSTTGIHADWLDAGTPTRVCTTLLEASGTTTELVENTAEMPESVLATFRERFAIYAAVADVTVLTGSLPANVSEEFYVSLTHQMTTELILDFRGLGLLNCLPWGPFLVKPNREELAATLGRTFENDADLIEGMLELNRRGAQWVVVSDGAGALFVTSDEGEWRLRPPSVNVVNPIGCGDCLAAGIAVARSEGSEPIEAVRFGMGAAAMNAMHLLPARLERNFVNELADQVVVEELG